MLCVIAQDIAGHERDILDSYVLVACLHSSFVYNGIALEDLDKHQLWP